MNVTTKMKAAAPVRPDLDPELNNLAMSKEAQPLFDAVKKHIEENVAPMSDEFFRLGEGRKDAWSWAPGQLDFEMQDNAWLVVDGDATLVFDTDFAAKWQRALDRLGSKGGLGGRFDPASFSHQSGRA